MKARKYKESYRIVDDGAGRRRAEYAGEYFRFPAGTPTAKRRALRAAALVGLYWLAALAYLRTSFLTGHCAYALVPFLIGLLPGAYAVMGLASMARLPARMTVVQKENAPGRLLRAQLGCGLFSGIGAVGGAVCLSVAGMWSAGWHEPLLAAAASAAAWTGFALCRRDYHALEKA